MKVVLDIHMETVAEGSCRRTSIEHYFVLARRLSVERGVGEEVEGALLHHCIWEAEVVAAGSPTFCYKLQW
jgi:hypothetical protein